MFAHDPELAGADAGVRFRQRPDFTFESAEPSVERLTGVRPEDLASDPECFWRLVHEGDAADLRHRFEGWDKASGPLSSVFRIRHAQTDKILRLCELRMAEINRSGQVEAFTGQWQDVTAAALLEQRMIAGAWHQTLSWAARGFAHDLNNALTGVLSLSEILRTQFGAGHAASESTGLLYQNARQAVQIVQHQVQLLQGKCGGARAYVDLNAVIAEAMPVLRHAIPKRIELVAAERGAALPAYVDPIELRQVIMRLAVAAAERIPNRGQIRLEGSRFEKLPTCLAGHGIRIPAVAISLTDDGRSIRVPRGSARLEHKPGAPTCAAPWQVAFCAARSFAERHNGAVAVESRPAAGTRISVCLPEADFSEGPQACREEVCRPRSVLLAGQRTQELLTMAGLLRKEGFHAVVADEDATALLLAPDYQFDALVIHAPAEAEVDPDPATLIWQERMPVKVVLCRGGGSTGRFDAGFLEKVDLVLPADVPEAELVAAMHSLWRAPNVK